MTSCATQNGAKEPFAVPTQHQRALAEAGDSETSEDQNGAPQYTNLRFRAFPTSTKAVSKVEWFLLHKQQPSQPKPCCHRPPLINSGSQGQESIDKESQCTAQYPIAEVEVSKSCSWVSPFQALAASPSTADTNIVLRTLGTSECAENPESCFGTLHLDLDSQRQAQAQRRLSRGSKGQLCRATHMVLGSSSSSQSLGKTLDTTFERAESFSGHIIEEWSF